MDIRPGMWHKYMPLRFDPPTGAHLVGGRYLFDSWVDVVDYLSFTSTELEFEPGVKFSDRPFFSGSASTRGTWHVAGAHDFTPMASTHYINRLERFIYASDDVMEGLVAMWPTMREAAETQGLASAWLLFQPDEHQIGIVTVAAKVAGTDDAENASRSLAALEHSESLVRYLPQNLLRTKPSTTPASTCPCGYPGPQRQRRLVGLPNLPRTPPAVNGARRMRSRCIDPGSSGVSGRLSVHPAGLLPNILVCGNVRS